MDPSMEIRMDMRADTYGGHFCTNLLEVRAKDAKVEKERLAWGLHAIGDSADRTHAKPRVVTENTARGPHLHASVPITGNRFLAQTYP